MPDVRVDTWKWSDHYGQDYWWSNRWFFRIPYSLHDEATYNFLKFVIQVEREVHYSHVHYDHCTMVLANDEGSDNPDNGITWAPDYGDYLGIHATTSTPASWNTFLKVRRYVDGAKVTNWWFRGCILEADLKRESDGKIYYPSFRNWNNILYNWTWYFWYYYGVYQIIPYGVNAYGTPIIYRDVTHLKAAGAIHSNKLQRAQTNFHTTGWNVFRMHTTLQKEFGEWLLTFGAWKTQSGDYAPCEQINNTADHWLGRIKAHAQKIQELLEGGSQSGTGGTGAVLRYGPNASEAQRIVTKIITDVPDDLEKIHAIPCWGGGSGTDYMLHTNVMEVNEIYYDYLGLLAQLSLLDFRNPSNA